MRRIGNVPNEDQANRLRDYLQTQSIDVKGSSIDESASPANTQHDIWIRDERDVEKARELFAEFQSDPSAKQYDVSAEAARLRKERSDKIAKKIAEQKKSQMRVRRVTSSMGGLGGRQSPSTMPVTIGFIVLATILGFITNFSQVPRSLDPATRGTGEQVFQALACVDILTFIETELDGFASIKQGQIWRLFTPMLLHGSMFHLAFNMFNLFILGGIVERIHGSAFYIGLLLVSQAVATSVQILIPDSLGSPLAIGASGAVLGVFGFVWIRPKIDGNYPVEIPQFNVNFMLFFVALCFTGLVGNIANGAHVGGLLTGMALAYAIPARMGT